MKNKIKDKSTARAAHRKRNKPGYLPAFLFVLCQLSTTIWLTSCTDDVVPADERTAGSPVELIARVAGHVQSRATADNMWDGGEEIGVQLDGKCYKYIADADGKLTAAPDEEIPRWSSYDDEKTVVAWYPYSDKLPETFTVKKNQENDEGGKPAYYKCDFLLAQETRISLGNPEITFRHLPAKVVINVKLGDGVTDADVSNLNYLYVSMHNQAFTSGKITPADGTVEPLSAGTRKDSLYANSLPLAASGFIKSFQVLLVPQMLSKDVPFLKVYTIQRGWFYYTPQDDDELILEPGKKYVYNITVMKEGLSVVRNEGIDEWDTEEKDIYRKEPKEGYRAQDLKLFDYYYNDGTWSDGGYRRYTDNTEAWLDVAPTEGKQVIGIVFQTDKNRMSPAEKNKGWEHGYAVSVTVCGDNSLVQMNECEWGIPESIPGLKDDALATFIDCKNFILGYEATRKVIDKIGNGHAEALKDTEYQAFYQACQYGKTDYTKQYAAPVTSSGWYLPSIGQWWDIAENLFGCEFEARGGSVVNGQKKPYDPRNITTQLKWIPGAQDFRHEYWTSSIYSLSYPLSIQFRTRYKEISLNTGTLTSWLYVRAVLAF